MSNEEKSSELEKTAEQATQFERGQQDAENEISPREGTPAYLRGYAERFKQVVRRNRSQPGVLTRDQIVPYDDIDHFYWRSDDGTGFIPK